MAAHLRFSVVFDDTLQQFFFHVLEYFLVTLEKKIQREETIEP